MIRIEFKIAKKSIYTFIINIIVSSSYVKSQDAIINSQVWGIELQGSKMQYLTSFGTDLLYRNYKNTYFAGFGLGYDSYNKTSNPILKVGYRRYTGKASNKIKFYYQTFFYYSTNRDEKLIYEEYLTWNLGVGIDYSFLKRMTIGLSTNYGAGYEFEKKSLIFTGFPLQFTLGYKL